MENKKGSIEMIVLIAIIIVTVSGILIYNSKKNEQNNQFVGGCTGVSVEYLQECCNNWARENNITIPLCQGAWTIEDNRCNWKCGAGGEEYLYICNEESNCSKVDKGCCCTEGSISINKNYLNYWNNKTSEECKGIACIAVACVADFTIPKCVNGKCELVKEPWKENQTDSYKKCMNETISGEYVKGEVLVKFNLSAIIGESIYHEVDNFFKSYGLEMKDYHSYRAVIAVPEGTELNWVCTFKEQKIIKDAYLNAILTVQSS